MNIENILITSNTIKENKFVFIYIILIWFALMPIFSLILAFIEYYYYFFLLNYPILLLFILPLLLLFYYVLYILLLLVISKLFLILINLIHKPKEGIFKIYPKNKDFYFYCLRKTIKRFVFRIYNYFPLPWAKILVLKITDIKIGSNSGVLDSYIDSDFIEFGKNIILGEGSIIMSSMIVDNFLLVKKVILKDNCTIGTNSILAPGTIVGKETILGMGSYTMVNQHLEDGWIYVGRPAKKMKKVEDNYS